MVYLVYVLPVLSKKRAVSMGSKTEKFQKEMDTTEVSLFFYLCYGFVFKRNTQKAAFSL